MNDTILMEIGTNGLRVNGMKWSTLGSQDQRSWSHKAKMRFGYLVVASFSTHLFK